MQSLEPPLKVGVGFAARVSGGTGGVAGMSTPHAHANDPRWQLALRIASSGSLGRSKLMSDFLLYIVDRHICGRTEEITEQQIGFLVFGREEGYDSNDDNIVRSYARNLRKRIDEYFAGEGREETLRLAIPRGGYAPIFSSKIQDAEPPLNALTIPDARPALAENGAEEPPKKSTLDNIMPPRPAPAFLVLQMAKLRPGVLLALCVGILLGFGGAFLKSARMPIASSAERASHALWGQLFSHDQDTFIVPSDGGLVIMQDLIERPVALAGYVNGSYRTDVKTDDVPGGARILHLSAKRYTSVADLDFVAHIAQLREVVPERMMVRYARDLRMDDLRTTNAILIGSEEANPWVDLFQPQMNFRFYLEPGVGKAPVFLNTHPRAGENAVYANEGEERTYGVIAFLPNLNSTGHVLILAGLNMAGTQAAGTLLLTPSLIMPTLERAKSKNGGLQPFELLVEAGNVATNASTPHIVLERIGSQTGGS
jgi:hypothetical protein